MHYSPAPPAPQQATPRQPGPSDIPAPTVAASTWGPPPPAGNRPTTTTGTPATRGWANWSQATRNIGWGTPRPGSDETASWSETSPGAVIRRRRIGSSTVPSTPAPPPSTTGDPGSDA
jgi:hypothetical protein